MQETATRTDKYFRGVGEPIGLEECRYFGIQQCVAGVEAVMVAVLTRKLDTSQQDPGLFFHGCDSLWLL